MKVIFHVNGTFYYRLSPSGKVDVYQRHLTQATIKRLWRLWQRRDVDPAGLRLDTAYFNW